MRSIFDVINELISVVPETEEQFHVDLKWCWEDAAYKAPEIQWMAWDRLTERFNRNITVSFEECNEWQKKAVAILLDKTVEELEAAK